MALGVVLKIIGPFWLKLTLRQLIFMGTNMGPQFGELPLYLRIILSGMIFPSGDCLAALFSESFRKKHGSLHSSAQKILEWPPEGKITKRRASFPGDPNLDPNIL